jgi:RNA polymerase sigma factor (sigma-70 family)
VERDAHSSFESLYRGHRAEVFRAALRAVGNVHDAEDVTQAAFVDAYRAVLRGTQPAAPRAWLLAIAENVRRRRYRSAAARVREEPLDADAALAAEDAGEQAGALVDALRELTPEQRDAFLLREIAGLSYDEIAERMGSSVASVQMLLFRARKALRNELEPPAVRMPAFAPLATLLTRFQGAGALPRAAGAAGAVAVAVGVASDLPARADPAPAPAAPPAAAVVTSKPVARPVAATQPEPAPRPARPAAARPVPAPARPAPAAPAPAQPVTPAPTVPAAPAQRARVPQPLPEPALEELPALVEILELEPVAPPAAIVESLVEDVVEDVESVGAAGAAGAGAPPLPDLPPDRLPPVPSREGCPELVAPVAGCP